MELQITVKLQSLEEMENFIMPLVEYVREKRNPITIRISMEPIE